MSKLNLLVALAGGAIVGASIALLLAPEKGKDLRSQIKELLHKDGHCCCDSKVDEIIAEITEATEK